MFQKPAFGATTSSFGSFNAGASTSSPFGGFKPATATGFSAQPTFGAGATTQPAAGGGLFGATNTTGGLFGASSAPTSSSGFGSNTSGFGFGPSTTSTGLFGGNTSTGLFGATQNNTAFGAKPAGFGFGGSANTGAAGGGLFGAAPAAGTGLFGQQSTSMPGGGLFANNTGAFGQAHTLVAGTAHAKYNPVIGTDVIVKSGTSQNVNIKHHCITCMKEYEGKSLEELRLEDYTAGRRGVQGGAVGGGMFGGFAQPQAQPQPDNKPLFGASTTFGQTAGVGGVGGGATSVFGGAANTGFGQSSFAFGAAQPQPAPATGLFAPAKPAFGAASTAGTGLFGTTTTQPLSFGAPTTNTSTFGFGTTTQNQTGGLFGAKPATSGFGTAPVSSAAGFGGFGTGGGGLFAAKTPAPAFGTPSFGTGFSGGFGTNTSTTGSLFGANNTFGKPTTTQPAFGFNTQPTLAGGGLGGGLGASSFAAKPAATGFAGLGGGTMFQQPANNNTFKTGLDSGLGGGMFSNTSALGGTGLGLGGMNTNTSTLGNGSLLGASAGGNVHEQILNLAARPYGDSPLFKGLLPDSGSTAEDVLKPTNPAAMKAVLASAGGGGGGAYRVTSPPAALRLRLQPRPALAQDKKSLFDGLEESDASLEDKLCLKPSRKRLVLRPKQREGDAHDSAEHNASLTNRSLEEAASPETRPAAGGKMPDAGPRGEVDEVDRVRRQVDFPENNNTEVSLDRHGSWLTSSKMPWTDKEKSIDDEPTPRLYPNLDKELPAQVSERRASWLTTKSLRKPLVSNPDSAENSVRELGVRLERSHDKENIDTLSASEEEVVQPQHPQPPHPAGVRLSRPGYYTIPSLEDMIGYMRPDGSCVVPHLTIGRRNYGNVYYDCEIDVAGMDLDALVHFLNKEVIVYPEDSDKPPEGEGLNRRAVVTLDRIWPRDKTEKRPITDPDRLLKMDYEAKLRRVCDKHDTKFMEYRPATGSWVFRVRHFSKYGLPDSDDDEPAPAMPAPKPPLQVPPAGLGGLGQAGAGGAGLGGVLARPLQDMDTAENDTETHTMYTDNGVFGVKSPTSELARLEHRQSHNVQLMKASLYADIDVEDDASVSTGDQMVPVSAPLLARPLPVLHDHSSMDVQEEIIDTEDTSMQPLIVQPHTIVLRYNRKVPPFKKTIAGRLNAACIADMSVCRARHARVGFGPGSALVFPTSYDSVHDLPQSAELCDLGGYVRGRAQDDWSEPVVVRMTIGRVDNADPMHEVLRQQLASLLEHSWCSRGSEGSCPRWQVSREPRARHALLLRLARHARAAQRCRRTFGVSGAYCYEVWQLCDALWGDDLENDGVPGTDDQSVVNRYRKLLDWMKNAVADSTDEDLAKPSKAEDEDDADGHSVRIWTLLLGGRILEACKVARDHGDLNMAVLISQAAGDPTFRSLISRQLRQWRECGADKLVSAHRGAALQLLAGAGAADRTDKLLDADWLRALHATARYLCPQVPTLERIIRQYEGFFASGDESDDGSLDLAAVAHDGMGMKLPLPPYVADYDVSVLDHNGKQRRVLDLRYELLRARAYNERPRLRPAACTPDPMDYSLCFLLGVWFGNPTVESITGVADQLEAAGDWHLAVQALAYHPDDNVRGHLIRGVVSRHAPARAGAGAGAGADEARLQLARRLQVPESWLLLAQAHRAKYENLPLVEAEHLAGARQWSAAHKVLVNDLLPEAVLTDNLPSISPLLEKMNAAAQKHEVSGWEGGGQALYQYLQVCDEIRGVVCAAEAARSRAGVQARLERLRPALAAACRALAAYSPATARGRAARAEMGGRLVQLALAAGEPPHHLAAVLHALKLPPDCTPAAHSKITTELAERASELCLESASSSPLSSHHRTITS